MLKYFALLLTLGAIACQPTPQSTETEEAGTPVSADTFEGDWPFTVESGRVRCQPWQGGYAVTFSADNGKRYALNGTGDQLLTYINRGEGNPDLQEIWQLADSADELRDRGVADDALPRISISDMIDEGLKICGES